MSEKSNPILGQEMSRFTFWNGDYYVGEFAIAKDKQQIVMEGNGIYITSDHQIYEGKWVCDFLHEAKRIVFSDQSEFSGALIEMKIQGPGKYRFKENVELEGNFVNNRMVEDFYLRDPGGHIWKGCFEVNKPVFVFFQPRHPFWQLITNMPKKNNFFYQNYSEEQDLWEV